MDHCHQFAGGNSHLPVAGRAFMEGKVTDATQTPRLVPGEKKKLKVILAFNVHLF